MTDSDEEDLRSLGRDLAAAQQSPWEPACIAHAFATPRPFAVCFTMQTWIDLAVFHSPLLLGKGCESLAEYEAAAGVFGLSLDGLEAAAVADVVTAVRREIEEAFAMGLPMRHPGASGLSTHTDDGFGAWLPVWAFLVVQCHLSIAEARALPVGQAYALMAAARRNQGWEVAGPTYAWRDLEESAADPAGNHCAGPSEDSTHV